MNPYTILNSGLGNDETSDLGTRLSAWHDAMVAHERKLRAGTSDACDDECPHAEARALWLEAVSVLGTRARDLVFLRSRAQDMRPSVTVGSSPARSETTARTRARAPEAHATTPAVSPATSVSTEL